MKGLYIALIILVCWLLLLTYSLIFYNLSWQNPLTYLLCLLQTHLYTGVFITAHDAMHGIICKNKRFPSC